MGLKYSIFSKELLRNLGGSACSGAACFSDHRKPTVVVWYQEVGGRLNLEEINPSLLPKSLRNFMEQHCRKLLAPRERLTHFTALGCLYKFEVIPGQTTVSRALSSIFFSNQNDLHGYLGGLCYVILLEL